MSTDSRSTAVETLSIADGLTRESCFTRARQSWAWANECRSRYDSLLDAVKKQTAISAAITWTDIAGWLDDTGSETFDWAQYEKDNEPSLADRFLTWTGLNFLRIPTWVFVCRALFGTKPITWYEEQEEAGDDAAEV